MSVCVVIVNIVKDEENFVVIIDYGVVFMFVKLVMMVRWNCCNKLFECVYLMNLILSLRISDFIVRVKMIIVVCVGSFRLVVGISRYVIGLEFFLIGCYKMKIKIIIVVN